MIAAFGVPTINLDNMTVKQIFDAYREPDATKKAALKASQKAAYAMQDVTIQMVGVWDTVGSLGIPGIFFNFLNQKKYGFLDTTLHSCVAYACHAVSIDERRAQFKPTLWTNPDRSIHLSRDWCEQIIAGDVGTVGELDQKTGLPSTYIKRILGCALLSPQITELILSGKHRPNLTLQELLQKVPMDWREQKRTGL